LLSDCSEILIFKWDFQKNSLTFRDRLLIAEDQTERGIGMMCLRVAFRNLEMPLQKWHWSPDSFHRNVQNATVPCCSQKLLPFLSVMYYFPPPFSTNYSSILPQPIWPTLSWFISQCCFPNFIYNTILGISTLFHSLYMPNTT
jgi:hypothetical protein